MWNLELEDFSTNLSITTTNLIQFIIIRKKKNDRNFIWTIPFFNQHSLSDNCLQALSDNPGRKLTKSVLTDSVVVSHEPIAREARAYWPIDFFLPARRCSKPFFSRNFLLFLLVYFNEKLSILTHLTLRHRFPVNRVFRICFDPC